MSSRPRESGDEHGRPENVPAFSLGHSYTRLSCVVAALVLVVSGFSYFVVQDVASIGSSHAIVSGPSIGPQNILLMGLESRRDWNGNILPNDILRPTRGKHPAVRTARR